MGKYDPLWNYLRRQRADVFELTFADVERRIGAMPPKGADRPQWWAEVPETETSPVQREAWRAAGFEAVLIVGHDRVRFSMKA